MFRILIGFWILLLLACQSPTKAAPQTAFTETQSAMTSELFIRIIKTTPQREKGVFQMWKRGEDGRFHLDRTFDICTWSGALGPKLKEGDGQSPEGFYFITPSSLNPNSSYHLSFNLGFPNAYDRAHGRTGSFLMVHGDCVSIGCYAMTDDGIEDIYSDVEDAFAGGQSIIRVHIFPFEMTEAALAAQQDSSNYAFWENLKSGWDWYENNRIPPNVTVVDKTYRFDPLE